MLKTVLILIPLLVTSVAQASPEVLSSYIQPGEVLTDVRNDLNLWQGHIHREGQVSYFHALINDGVVTHWYEKAQTTDMAVMGQSADVASTVAGLSQGAVELNPLGLAILPAKYLLNNYVETLPYNQCKKGKAWLGAFGWGPAAANVAVLAAGAFSPAGVVLGLAVGAWGFEQGMETGRCDLWVGPVVAEEITTGEVVVKVAMDGYTQAELFGF